MELTCRATNGAKRAASEERHGELKPSDEWEISENLFASVRNTRQVTITYHVTSRHHEGRVSLKSYSYSFSPMVVRSQSSAAGVLALLHEPDPLFKQHALNALNPLVPQFWAEISEHIALMCVSSLPLHILRFLILVIVNHSMKQMIFLKLLAILPPS
jgi:hypothetical protein